MLEDITEDGKFKYKIDEDTHFIFIESTKPIISDMALVETLNLENEAYSMVLARLANEIIAMGVHMPENHFNTIMDAPIQSIDFHIVGLWNIVINNKGVKNLPPMEDLTIRN